jgi:hypothetical protein
VEYVVEDADQSLSTDSDRPSLFGHRFDGPMPGHFPGMPVHYDLHVWAWFDNPNGAYSAWNPESQLLTQHSSREERKDVPHVLRAFNE